MTKKTDGEFLKRSKARGRSTDGWERKKTPLIPRCASPDFSCVMGVMVVVVDNRTGFHCAHWIVMVLA